MRCVRESGHVVMICVYDSSLAAKFGGVVVLAQKYERRSRSGSQSGSFARVCVVRKMVINPFNAIAAKGGL